MISLPYSNLRPVADVQRSVMLFQHYHHKERRKKEYAPEQTFQMNGFKVLVRVGNIPRALVPRVGRFVLRALLGLLRTP